MPDGPRLQPSLATVAAVLAVSGLGLAGAVAGACGGGSGGAGAGPSPDSGADQTVPNEDGGSDDVSLPGIDVDAGPPRVPARVYLVNASPDAPPLRFCLGFGPPADGGAVLVAGGLSATPDQAGAFPVAGLYPGFGGVMSDHGLDLDTLTLDIFALDARNPIVAANTAAGNVDGGLETPCEGLIGSDGLGAASDAGGVLSEGRDYWAIGSIPMGQLAHGTTWLAAVTGCTPAETSAATLCPTGYDPTAGNLRLLTWQLDGTTVVGGGALGAQFAQASSEWDILRQAQPGGASTVAAFLVPGDGGAGGAGDAGDGGAQDAGEAGAAPSPWTSYTQIPVALDAGFGALLPLKLASVPGLAFDGTTAFGATIVDSTGAAIAPTPIGWPLVSSDGQAASVQSFTWGDAVPEGGALRNGAGFVFVLVGNPATTALYVDPGDGGPSIGPDAGGILNGHVAHFLAFPVANQQGTRASSATMRVLVLGSGSSGNCLVVEAEGERVLIDAGMGPTRATERMRALGADLITSRAPLGLFVTHDHGDHAAHALPLARSLRTPVFAHAGVAIDRTRKRLEVRDYAPGRPIALGPFVVEAVALPHDAPHVALRVSAGGRRVAIATDLGHATRELRAMLASSDLVLLESNYCPRMLEAGPYPPRLKRRVGGPLGHLANEQTADLAASLEDTRVTRLVLVHLSRTNNTPERALGTVASRLRRLPVEALPHGEPRRLDVAGSGLRGAEQLRLGF